HPVELRLLHEPLQRRELLLRLAGEADDEGRADGDIGRGSAEIGQQLQIALIAHRAAHRAQHRVVGVLQRHVNIVTDLRSRRYRLYDTPIDARRVAVEQAYPANSV